MGCASAFQADETSSNLVLRSNIQDDPVIQDEQALLKPIDYELMARIYEWQAIAADPNVIPDYRDHYMRKLQSVRDELNIIIDEVIRCQLSIAKEEQFLQKEYDNAN